MFGSFVSTMNHKNEQCKLDSDVEPGNSIIVGVGGHRRRLFCAVLHIPIPALRTVFGIAGDLDGGIAGLQRGVAGIYVVSTAQRGVVF